MRDIYPQRDKHTIHTKPAPSAYQMPEKTITVSTQGNQILIQLNAAHLPQFPIQLNLSESSSCKAEKEPLPPKSLFGKAEKFLKEHPVLTFTVCFAGLHMIEKIVESFAKTSGGAIQMYALTGISFISALKFFINKQPTSRK